MSFWSDLSKATASNWYDNPNPVVLGYGDDGQGNLTPDYGDIFKYLRGSSDPEAGTSTPDNQAAMDAFKNLPVLPNLTNINNTNRTGMLNGRQVQWGMPGANAEEFSPTGDGRQARAMSTQGDTRFAQIAGRTEDGKLVFGSPIRSQAPPRQSKSGFIDSFMEFLPMAATFAGGISGLQGLGALPAGGTNALAGSDPFLGESSLFGDEFAGDMYAADLGDTMSDFDYGSMDTDVIPEFDYAAGGSPDYRQPPAVPVGSDPFLGEASVLGGGGTTAPITPGLIAQLAKYTGLSTGAIERLGGAAISSLAGLYGAGMVGSAADRAAKGIADANANSNALLAAIDARNKAREEPFYQAGLNALPTYTKGVMPGGDLVRPFAESDFKVDPGYGFRLSEGLKAMDRSAASRGNLLSGATIKGAQRYGQDLASTEYDRAYNRYGSDQATRRNALASLTGFAPTASSAIRSSDMAYGGNATNLASNTANAMAGAGATRASAYGNTIAGIGQNAYNALSPNPFAQYMQRQLG